MRRGLAVVEPTSIIWSYFSEVFVRVFIATNSIMNAGFLLFQISPVIQLSKFSVSTALPGAMGTTPWPLRNASTGTYWSYQHSHKLCSIVARSSHWGLPWKRKLCKNRYLEQTRPASSWADLSLILFFPQTSEDASSPPLTHKSEVEKYFKVNNEVFSMPPALLRSMEALLRRVL